MKRLAALIAAFSMISSARAEGNVGLDLGFNGEDVSAGMDVTYIPERVGLKIGFGATLGTKPEINGTIPHGDYAKIGGSGGWIYAGPAIRSGDRLIFSLVGGIDIRQEVVRSNATGWTWYSGNNEVKPCGGVIMDIMPDDGRAKFHLGLLTGRGFFAGGGWRF